MNQQHKGKVILAGAGPGDPELLTLKAHRYLQQADVVITDRLVSDTILHEYTKKEALILHAGKQCRKGASTPQSLINELLLEYALQGKLVVRLKGGDVCFFSNILDELQVLSRHHIDYEIIPGVTAASGAAAYAGIPLTARDHATAVRFITYYQPGMLGEDYWKELAHTNDTLVFYMSADTHLELVEKLTAYNPDREKHIAVIEQATTPMQRVFHCNINDYAKKYGGERYVSPALIIVGKVAALHEQFNWMPEGRSRASYFKEIEKNIKAEARA